jgi:methylamine---glutamate N-methyltransferase subunit A
MAHVRPFPRYMCGESPHVRRRLCLLRTWKSPRPAPNVAGVCGIVGIFAKSQSMRERLGSHLGEMLAQLAERGPDSAGVAVYRDPAPPGATKLSLYAPAGADWDAVGRALDATLGVERMHLAGPRHALLVVRAEPQAARERVAQLAADRAKRTDRGEISAGDHRELQLFSAGREMEIYKEAGPPARFAESVSLQTLSGSHAIGHTRMATESRVSTDGSHPFTSGRDLCLVHNGSLSNHNRLRERLRGEGISFDTENDSEVAAGYLTWRLREGASLGEALAGCLGDLDGFYTFAVGTPDGFAVLRDPIACKPAVMGETDEWVAIASEYRALAVLPGAAAAELWEPEPGRVYSWSRDEVELATPGGAR